MKLKTFTLRFDPERGVFDDAEMTTFLEDKRVLDRSEHFFVHEQRPIWAVIVTYRESEASDRDVAREDWRASLSDAERAVFDAIRKWRNERAKKDGRPPYVILTNRQLAEIAQKRPDTAAKLREIEGIGESRTAEYGAEILALARAATTPDKEARP